MLHITLTIPSVLALAFIVLLTAPLPILLLSYPLSFIKERLEYHNYYTRIKKHKLQPGLVTILDLHSLFPNKKEDELFDIMLHLKESAR